MLIYSLACALITAQEGLPSYSCPKVSVPPKIDGSLDDDAWAKANPIILVRSETGKHAVKKTMAKMVWDDTCLYICFDCEDEDIWGTLTNRDDPIYTEEVVEAFIAPNGDLTSYFEFNVSPRNTVFDARIIPAKAKIGIDYGPSRWDCAGLRTAVVVDGTLDIRTDIDRKWSAEFAIPFASLGVDTPKPGDKWRINLYRIDTSPEPLEYQAWSPTLVDPANFHVPQRFGILIFE